jgi:hypothetical protein
MKETRKEKSQMDMKFEFYSLQLRKREIKLQSYKSVEIENQWIQYSC